MSQLRSRRTLLVAVISVLAALDMILSIPPGPVGFRRLSIVMEPLEGLYQFYGLPFSAWLTIFIAGVFQTPVEAVYSVVIASVVGVLVLMALRTARIIDWPLSP